MNKNLQEQLAAASEKVREAMEGDDVKIPINPETLLDKEAEVADDSEAQEAASDSPSESSEDVKDEDVNESEVDEKGVSFKNRYHEAVRKQDAFKKELDEIKAKLDSLSTKNPEQTVSTLRSAPQTFDPYQVPQPVTRTVADVDGNDEAPITKAEAINLAKTMAAKERNDNEALMKFPDLNNHESPMFKETLRRVNLKKQMGVSSEDPLLLLETATAVFGDMVLTGHIVPKKAQEARDAKSSKNSVIVTPRRSAAKPTTSKLSPMEQYTLEKFQEIGIKMTPEQYAQRKNRR